MGWRWVDSSQESLEGKPYHVFGTALEMTEVISGVLDRIWSQAPLDSPYYQNSNVVHRTKILLNSCQRLAHHETSRDLLTPTV